MKFFKLPFRKLNSEWPLHPCVPICLSNPLDSYEIYQPTLALIDTGAIRSAIPDWIAKELYHCHENEGVVQKNDALGIGGAAKVYEHTFDLEITDFEDKSLHTIENIKLDVIVSKNPKDAFTPSPAILGLEDFIVPYVETIDFTKKYFILKF